MMTSPQIIILHGTHGSPQSNWYHWLQSELVGRGYNAVVPKLPTPDGQTPENWENALKSQEIRIDSRSVIVGHSLGAVFALSLVGRSLKPVSGLYLVCPFEGPVGNEEYDRLNAPFFMHPIAWNRIKMQGGYIRVFAGENDPYVPLEMSRSVAEHLQKPLAIVKDGGHLNAESGFTKFEKLRNDLLESFPL